MTRPEDIELADELLRNIEQALSTTDLEIRQAVRRFAEATASAEGGASGVDGKRPWLWLAAVCQTANQVGDIDIAPRALLLTRWWMGLSDSLTLSDLRNMRMDLTPQDARATIASCALSALQSSAGNTIVVAAPFVDAGQARRIAYDELQDLLAVGAPLPSDVRSLLAAAHDRADAAFLVDLGRYGRGYWSDFSRDIDPGYDVELELLRRHEAGGRAFIHDVVTRATSAGGWTAVGACRGLINALHVEPADTDLAPLLDVAVAELQRRQMPALTLTGYEHGRWIETLGNGRPWAPLTPAPARDSHTLLALESGASRLLVTLTHNPHSNRFIVTRDADDFVWYIDRPESSATDPVRIRTENGRLQDQWNMYAQIAEAVHAPPAWTSPDFQPFVRCSPMDLLK